MIHLDRTGVESFVPAAEFARVQPRVLDAQADLLSGSGAGSEFLGWRTILRESDDHLLADIKAVAAEIRERADVLLCIGIGGSYLGARAIIDALTPYFAPAADGPAVLFAGHHLSGSYLRDLLASLEGRSVYVNVISKSGTTLEPAVAFRFVRQWMEDRFPDAADRIIVTTDPERGALNRLQAKNGYRKFVIPPDVGGRFSVLTPVGLLPIAVSGIDIESLFEGARACMTRLEETGENDALAYAATRYLLHDHGYTTDIMAVFEPKLAGIAGWWQQLFGESEGKGHRGLFPVGVQYSTDLHSLGQYVQDGRRNVIETFLVVRDEDDTLTVPSWDADEDGLNYLAGTAMQTINRKAYQGTAAAHLGGSVPVMTLTLPTLSAPSVGALIYFFEHAVSVSGYLLEINPFDQPGVEAYKKEMFSLLGKR